ncbi:C2H2 finger domain-containing protein [Colletotrichum tofieldiae]|uniref:C2H2 finger domain-containing protein n=1 Tax=Colletotrichum tofieldiae TaxID=708197 RepID=A0A166YEZ2_9PEZI|nr:C2H2 finger domain-containing protein [Colletotrichum tofieldiae]GKT56986.1 C2H2 finger domain-containing protein [Colletotrichum tofieldiae]GKT78718.1 C2H2 finger domain-containing protein [Colletotrichum tofieldiae]
MPPPMPTDPEAGSAAMDLGNQPPPRQRTLDMFLNRSGIISLPSPSPSSVPPRRTSTAQPAPRSTFAVVLKSSPGKRSEATPARTVEDDADDLGISDLSPQFRRLAAQAASDVSLAKPALPAAATDELDAASPGTTPPPQPRKRGRPKGFRPSVTGTRASQGDAPATGPRRLRPDRPKTGAMYAGKRRGRPPRVPSPQPRTIYERLNPRFNVFICEWKGCKAELHNFATLQKHVLVVHAKDDPFACRWAECAEQQPPRKFSTSVHLKSHLEDLHMLPIAWQVGDGPQVSFKRYDPDDGAELPDYLFDKAGDQVTPSIRDQKEEDFYTWRNNRRRLKDLLLLRDKNMPSEGEDNGMEETVEGR